MLMMCAGKVMEYIIQNLIFSYKNHELYPDADLKKTDINK